VEYDSDVSMATCELIVRLLDAARVYVDNIAHRQTSLDFLFYLALQSILTPLSSLIIENNGKPLL
jgi:hypothetical protein